MRPTRMNAVLADDLLLDQVGRRMATDDELGSLLLAVAHHADTPLSRPTTARRNRRHRGLTVLAALGVAVSGATVAAAVELAPSGPNQAGNVPHTRAFLPPSLQALVQPYAAGSLQSPFGPPSRTVPLPGLVWTGPGGSGASGLPTALPASLVGPAGAATLGLPGEVPSDPAAMHRDGPPRGYDIAAGRVVDAQADGSAGAQVSATSVNLQAAQKPLSPTSTGNQNQTKSSAASQTASGPTGGGQTAAGSLAQTNNGQNTNAQNTNSKTTPTTTGQSTPAQTGNGQDGAQQNVAATSQSNGQANANGHAPGPTGAASTGGHASSANAQGGGASSASAKRLALRGRSASVTPAATGDLGGATRTASPAEPTATPTVAATVSAAPAGTATTAP